MADTALYMGAMARKKRVLDKYVPNSYRVISEDAESSGMKLPPLSKLPEVNILGQGKESNSFQEYRYNRPNPRHVNFLRQDVKLLNEPVCDVYTRKTKEEQRHWWPHQSEDNKVCKPEHTLDTIVRGDYQYRGSSVKGNTRHSSNPNKEPVQGSGQNICSVPVNFLRKRDGNQRFWKEGISYEHQYNCRLDPQYPVRSKRHGAFVWDEFPPAEVDRMLHSFGYKADKKEGTSEKSVSHTQTPVSAATSKGQEITNSNPSSAKSGKENANNPCPESNKETTSHGTVSKEGKLPTTVAL